MIANQHMYFSSRAVRLLPHSQDKIESLAVFVTATYDVPKLNDDQVPADPVIGIIDRAGESKRTPCSADIRMNIANGDYPLLTRDRIALTTAKEQPKQ
jgi:hypothetical protein